MKVPQHTTNTFLLQDHTKVQFSSAFDSGNCAQVRRINDKEYQIDSHPDYNIENGQESYAKSWFHFRVTGFSDQVIFHVLRVKALYNLWQSGNTTSYRPVVRIGNQGVAHRLDSPSQLNFQYRDNSLRLTFTFDFSRVSPSDHVYFSFSYPYSYQRNLDYVASLGARCALDPTIYFHKEILTYTSQQRPIHLLTISSNDRKTIEQESFISDSLFPERETQPRAIKFAPCKPVILISARVHPGETPASFALEGLIDFLTNSTDLRALLLRKFFTFMIIPMLNPDGVHAGHFRMDLNNQNLNRYYLVSTHAKQPAIFAAKRLITHLASENRLFFYMDLHAHCGRKGTFLYGNALEDFALQVETQLFAKVMELNDPTFEYEHANFTKAQMKSKDRQDDLTKEGCGRVFVHQATKIIHSYTLECGFHHMATPRNNKLARPSCSNPTFQPIIGTQTYCLVEQNEMFNQIQAENENNSSSNSNTSSATVIIIPDNQQKEDTQEYSHQINNNNSQIIIKQSQSEQIIHLDIISETQRNPQSEKEKQDQYLHQTSMQQSTPNESTQNKTSMTPNNVLIQPNQSNAIPNQQQQNQQPEIEFLTDVHYRESGRAVLLSLLDVYEKNPYSRVPETTSGSMDVMRREMAMEHARAIRVIPIIETATTQPPKKVKNILILLNESHFRRIDEMKIFKFNEKVVWPPAFHQQMLYKFTGKQLSSSSAAVTLNHNSNASVYQSSQQFESVSANNSPQKRRVANPHHYNSYSSRRADTLLDINRPLGKASCLKTEGNNSNINNCNPTDNNQETISENPNMHAGIYKLSSDYQQYYNSNNNSNCSSSRVLKNQCIPSNMKLYPLHQVKFVQLSSNSQLTREQLTGQIFRKGFSNYLNEHYIEEKQIVGAPGTQAPCSSSSCATYDQAAGQIATGISSQNSHIRTQQSYQTSSIYERNNQQSTISTNPSQATAGVSSINAQQQQFQQQQHQQQSQQTSQYQMIQHGQFPSRSMTRVRHVSSTSPNKRAKKRQLNASVLSNGKGGTTTTTTTSEIEQELMSSTPIQIRISTNASSMNSSTGTAGIGIGPASVISAFTTQAQEALNTSQILLPFTDYRKKPMSIWLNNNNEEQESLAAGTNNQSNIIPVKLTRELLGFSNENIPLKQPVQLLQHQQAISLLQSQQLQQEPQQQLRRTSVVIPMPYANHSTSDKRKKYVDTIAKALSNKKKQQEQMQQNNQRQISRQLNAVVVSTVNPSVGTTTTVSNINGQTAATSTSALKIRTRSFAHPFEVAKEFSPPPHSLQQHQQQYNHSNNISQVHHSSQQLQHTSNLRSLSLSSNSNHPHHYQSSANNNASYRHEINPIFHGKGQNNNNHHGNNTNEPDNLHSRVKSLEQQRNSTSVALNSHQQTEEISLFCSRPSPKMSKRIPLTNIIHLDPPQSKAFKLPNLLPKVISS